ncbi:MAG TPA: sigma-70 family RNA polymerase sigma factor [Candidatus Eisenbacteria bacterium]|jgi:RNA polymerase sigma-70 factor (ECF subfamily)
MPDEEDRIDTEPQTPLGSTAALLIRVRAGEPAAREQLAARYLTSLRRWAHGRLPARARDLVDTDDLVQSTLMRAFNKVGEFEPRREGAFLAYIRQILLNLIRDQARRGRRRPEHVELPDDVAAKDRSLLDEVIGRQNMDRYELALARLSDSYREAVILRVEMGYRYREIAEGMDLPTANAARKLIGRALVQLAELMRGHDGT